MAASGSTSDAESTTPMPHDWKRLAMAGSNTVASASMVWPGKALLVSLGFQAMPTVYHM
jgi:hypothetical protein